MAIDDFQNLKEALFDFFVLLGSRLGISQDGVHNGSNVGLQLGVGKFEPLVDLRSLGSGVAVEFSSLSSKVPDDGQGFVDAAFRSF